VGPPGIAAARKVSVAIQYRNGLTKDVRAFELEFGTGESKPPVPVTRPAVPNARPPAPLVQEPSPTVAFQKQSNNFSRPVVKPLNLASLSDPPKPLKLVSRFSEHVNPPQKYVSGNFPTKNFIKAVIEKDPRKDEADAPDTQTIVAKKAGYKQPLPDDEVFRQKELVRIYTMETHLYPEMNLALRQDDFTRLKYYGAFIKELRDVFYTDNQDQIITPFEGTVWRGITVPNVNNFLKDFLPNEEFVWEAFTSTTTDREVALGFGNVTFEIHCLPPVTGSFSDDDPEYAPADIKQFSDMQDESEVLFPPNVRFRVITVQQPTPTNQLQSPLVICETLGYDTIWGLIDSNNQHEVIEWCKQKKIIWSTGTVIHIQSFTHSLIQGTTTSHRLF